MIDLITELHVDGAEILSWTTRLNGKAIPTETTQRHPRGHRLYKQRGDDLTLVFRFACFLHGDLIYSCRLLMMYEFGREIIENALRHIITYNN